MDNDILYVDILVDHEGELEVIYKSKHGDLFLNKVC